MAMHPLIDTTAVASRLDDPELRIVDCRWSLGRPGAGFAAYAEGHLPAAIHVDVDTVLTAPPEIGPGRHPLPEPSRFAADLGALGIGTEHLVVAYDDVGGWVAARLWWMLDVLGHQRVAVLDGGLQAWTAAGLPLTTDMPAYPATDLRLAGAWARTIERDALRARLGDVTLLDARAGARYRGEIEPIDAVPGHIPTAVSAPTDGNLAPDGRFLPPAELAARYRELGADGSGGGAGAAGDGGVIGRPVVTSCGSGVSACHHALAMRAAGLPDPLLYPGSYSDWTQQGLAVAVGPEPGEPPVSRR